MHFARAVRGDDHDRRRRGAHRAEFGDRHLEVGQDLEEEGLEGFVGAVEFIDEQDGGLALQRLEQRAGLQEAAVVDAAFQRLAVRLARGFGEADRHQLLRVVPLIGRGREVEPVIALQPDKVARQHLRQHLRDLGLAGPRFAFEEERPAHAQREMHRGGQRAVGDIAAGREQRLGFLDRGGNRHRNISATMTSQIAPPTQAMSGMP